MPCSSLPPPGPGRTYRSLGLRGHEWSHQVAELFRLRHEALTLALDLPDVLARVAGVGLSEYCGGEARPDGTGQCRQNQLREADAERLSMGRTLLGESGDLISKVIGTLIWVVRKYTMVTSYYSPIY